MRYYNNPFNIRTGESWKGLVLTPSQDRFCEFCTVGYSVRAFLCILLSYKMRGKSTIEKIINSYAPDFENNTQSYITFVCVGRSADLFSCFTFNRFFTLNLMRPLETYVFARRICQMESNYVLTFNEFDEGYKMFIKDKFSKLVNYE